MLVGVAVGDSVAVEVDVDSVGGFVFAGMLQAPNNKNRIGIQPKALRILLSFRLHCLLKKHYYIFLFHRQKLSDFAGKFALDINVTS